MLAIYICRMQFKDSKVNARGVLPRVKLLVFVIPLPS